jgi:hypothetical protein
VNLLRKLFQMKTKLASVLVLVIILLAGCDVGTLPTRTEAFTNEFHVVNFVSTNKVFIANEQGMTLRMTAESAGTLTNGQTVSGEAVIRGIAPSGVIERIIVYPKQ